MVQHLLRRSAGGAKIHESNLPRVFQLTPPYSKIAIAWMLQLKKVNRFITTQVTAVNLLYLCIAAGLIFSRLSFIWVFKGKEASFRLNHKGIRMYHLPANDTASASTSQKCLHHFCTMGGSRNTSSIFILC